MAQNREQFETSFKEIMVAFAGKEGTTSGDVIELSRTLRAELFNEPASAPAPQAAATPTAAPAPQNAPSAPVAEQAKPKSKAQKAKAPAKEAPKAPVKADVEAPAPRKRGRPSTKTPPKVRSVEEMNEVLGEAKAAVSKAESVTHDQVYCMECGQGFSMLKRHLGQMHGLNPEEYRLRFGLASDHPLIAPEYSERKAELARELDFGKHEREQEQAE